MSTTIKPTGRETDFSDNVDPTQTVSVRIPKNKSNFSSQQGNDENGNLVGGGTTKSLTSLEQRLSRLANNKESTQNQREGYEEEEEEEVEKEVYEIIREACIYKILIQ
eukprot:c1526_g1_i1.p1 GENE.c1526_g1_i1~~c1526_g1_i1.p1  ORF type:complete len:108 (-),score=48.78 c1526_g1_i1:50-373(-)